jgi:aminoglycoside 6'-N-acetyltransferase I
MSGTVDIERCASPGDADWRRMRAELWPDCPDADHDTDMTLYASSSRLAAFMARDGSGTPIGFVEVSLRSDYVNGTSTSPVGFIEGIYVTPDVRLQGVARALVQAAEAWARGKGCSEMASDCRIENEASHAMHRALGYDETDRVVYFRKSLVA